ncbi:hypothetical protein BDW59DRAFT_176655 [Aspergillus cavernicola]|uniref:FAD-binding domain-containing protein n=1 Tax=Aspergillus cavernicola TaxID=176166 RepID=A0ABR4HEP1_9EURO
MSRSKPAPIAIVGGGPSGLIFARLLEVAGISYVVFERDASSVPAPGYQGGTLDIHGKTGQEALRRAGLHAEFEKLARRDATSMVVQDYRGNHHFKFDEERDAPEIDRVQLRQILLDSLPAHRVKWGKRLCAAERDETKKQSNAADIKLHFTDGSTETGFRLVVGADGGWSKLRQLITPAEPEYAGIMFIEGKLSVDNPQYDAALDMVGSGNSIAMSERSILCVQQMSDRSYRVYMGIKGPQDLTRPGGDLDVAKLDEARAAILAPEGFYGDWAPHLRAFVSDAEGPWRVWPWCRLNPHVLHQSVNGSAGARDQSQHHWKHAPGIALMGDAAHLSSPNGEGVNRAMYDALVLFERITAELSDKPKGDFDEEADAEALDRGVAAYETEMLPCGRALIEDGLNVERAFFGDDAALNLIKRFKDMPQSGKP